MSLHRRQFLQHAAALALGASAAPSVFAQARGNIRVFVGFPPGGLPDLVARAVADQLARSLGGAAIVENRPGANGRIAGQAVKSAAPDGNTLLVAPASGMVHLPHVYNDLGFDPLTDFVPVAQLVENDFAFGVSAKLPINNLKEFAAWAKANPDKATFASPGQGSSPHLMGLMAAKAMGVTLTHVPYKGSNFALTDLIGGHIPAMVSASSFLVQAHKAGTVRILATTGRARSSVLPNVPTFKEQGMDDLLITEGTWLMAPAKTPAATLAQLSAAALESIKSPQMASVIDGQTIAAPLGSKELAVVMKQEFEKRGAQVKAFGFTANS